MKRFALRTSQFAMLLCVLCVSVSLFAGCTQGQLAPQPMKDCAYAAQADGQVTLGEYGSAAATQPTPATDEGRYWKARADELAAALVRVCGDGKTDGLISPLVRWFKGEAKKQ